MFEWLDHDESRERCGVFFIGGKVNPDKFTHSRYENPSHYVGLVVELPNRAYGDGEFKLTRSDINRVLVWLDKDEEEILGFWHTHPARYSQYPSDADLESVAVSDNTNWWHCVYSLKERSLCWYDYAGNITEYHDTYDRPHKALRQRSGGMCASSFDRA